MDVRGYVGCQEGPSLARVEVAEAFGADGTSLNVVCREGFGLVLWICSLRWENVGNAALDWSDLSWFVGFISYSVSRHQRVDVSCGFELSMRNVSVVHGVVVVSLAESLLALLDLVAVLGLSSFNVGYVHVVSGLEFYVLFLLRFGSLDVVDAHLVANETRWFWGKVNGCL